MALIQKLVDKSKYDIKCPYTMNAVGIVLHNTANDASAENEIKYMTTNNNEVSYHIAVDDKEAIQGLPLNRNGWHCGDGGKGNGNRNYIGVEICYSKSGGQRFLDAEKRCAKEVASLLKQYGWGIDRVKKHQDFSGKYCPHRTLDMGYNRLIEMIKAELNGANPSNPVNPSVPSIPSGDYYRVVAGSYSDRTNANSQIEKLKTIGIDAFLLAVEKDGKTYLRVIAGSFKDRKNAEKSMNDLIAKGYNAFIAVYSEAGDRVPSKPEPPKPPVQTGTTLIKSYGENGKATVTGANAVNVRSTYKIESSEIVAKYSKNESFSYDTVYITEYKGTRYVWCSYISGSGVRRYVCAKEGNTRYLTCK